MRLLVLVFAVLVVSSLAYADKVELKPFLYTQDFEGQDPVPTQPWAVGAQYKINSQGLTTEKAHTGRQSYKIDVTFENGNYLYFNIPLNTPIQGKFMFSAYVYVPDENQGRVGTGVNFAFPPTTLSGCGPLNGETFTNTNGEWRHVQGDLVIEGKRTSVGVILQNMWGITTEEMTGSDVPGKELIGISVDRIGIFLLGEMGKRVVMYLDDIKIEGQAPDSSAYGSALQARWAPIKARVAKKMASWSKAFLQVDQELSRIKLLDNDTTELKKEAQANLATARKRFDAAGKKPYLEQADQIYIDGILKQIASMVTYIKQTASSKSKFTGIRVAVVPAVSDIKILPTDSFMPGKVSDTITISACPGEITSGSFIVRPNVDINSLLATPGDLKSSKGVISASNIDIKLVKCWYQAGTAWQDVAQDKSHRILVPELLLNDDKLIKVDFNKQDNYLRGSFKDGERYIWISDSSISVSDSITHSIQDYPVSDSPKLLPVSLKARTNQQYWITIKVPANAKAGKYSGRITLSDGSKTLGSLNLKFTVLPFKLDPPYYTSSVYYRGVLGRGWEQGSIGSEFKSEQQLEAEMRDMVEHGVDNPTVYQGIGDKELLDKYLKLLHKAGSKSKSLYSLGTGLSAFKFTTPEGLGAFKQACIDTKAFCKQYGIHDLYVYGVDEATGEVLASQRKAFAAAHEAGVKLFVAGYAGTFDAVGDLLDILVYAHIPSAAEAKKWHSIKHSIWSYANPQAGVENPLAYRRNYGLLLWKQNFDGACTYAYQHAMGSIWNDFDDITYRDLCFTYPTTTGVIDTIAWEGYREGVNDVRYLTTLLNAIKRAKSTGRVAAAINAEKYLNSIDVQNGDPDATRSGLVKQIMLLKKTAK
jgi:hypothetical protein